MKWNHGLFADCEDNFLQIGVAGGVAEHDFEFAGFNAEFHVDIIEGKEVGRNLESDSFGSAGLECNSLEPFEFFDGASD